MIRWAILVFLAFIVTACGSGFEPQKSESEDRTVKTTSTPDFSNLTPHEIIQEKYEKAQFICRLWVQQGLELFTSNEPNAVVTWDLLSDFAENKTFFMKGTSATESSTASLETALKIDVLKVDILTSFHHKPVIDLKVEYHYRVGTEQMAFYFANGTYLGRIYENVKGVPLNTATTFKPADGSHFNYLECTIETELKADFK